ncbi:MAG TPA: biotin/lipoyl-binding protein, partial [Nitrospirota bacterium]
MRNEHHRRGKATIAVFALMTGTLLLFQACSKGKQPPPRIVPVIAELAEKKDVPLQIKAIGKVEPNNTVAVKSQVSGEIAEVYFQEGRDVRRGSPLFRIDPRPFEATLRQAEAALARDRAQDRNAQEEAKRYAALVEKNFISRQEYERNRTNADASSAVVRAD